MESSKKFNKVLFAILLIPAYLVVLILALNLFLGFGAVMWGFTAATLALTFAGASLLSINSSRLLNALGLVCFIALGGYQALAHFFQPGIKYGPWMTDVYIGSSIVLMAVIAFICQLVKAKKST